ncbi:MAG: polysaccharide deacetylase family protein [Streptosporangiaceae bacterium]
MSADIGTSQGRRLAVSLTFDFDAESAWLGAFGVNTPSALSRGAYGAAEGVPRILKLLSRYDLPATFFIPGDTADRHPEVTKTIVDAGHEIGHHGYLHEPPTRLDLAAEREMIERGLDALDRQAGVRPAGYRSPSWELSENTFDLLTEYGFDYDASQLGADRPYWVSTDGQRRDLVELPGAWELTDSSHFLFAFVPSYLTGLAAPSKVEEIWRGDFDGLLSEESDACYVLTMHPQIIGRHHRLQMLERVIEHILAQDGVWITQMKSIAKEFRARQETPGT